MKIMSYWFSKHFLLHGLWFQPFHLKTAKFIVLCSTLLKNQDWSVNLIAERALIMCYNEEDAKVK
jgi:hypothetical protein